LAQARGQRQAVVHPYQQAPPIWREANDHRHVATTLNAIGNIYTALGEPQQALKCDLDALLLRHLTGDKRGEAGTLSSLAGLYVNSGDMRRAIETFSQALELRRIVGDRRGEAVILGNLGFVHQTLGE